ncbi:hypothetical protein C0995_002377 [Termitomyces sp. Mi166|nr:hypothetical protein C0995_002377 [Termitomyces sp. Mi166\
MSKTLDSPQEQERVSSPQEESLRIPEARDGFFGYSEEKSLQQIEEKYWAQRRSSDARSDGSFSNFKLTPLQTSVVEEQGNLAGSALEVEEEPFPSSEAPASDAHLNNEFAALFQSFQRCLDLRDKYMAKSLQRLGDNPKDYDGDQPSIDKDLDYVPPRHFEKWNISPPPPPPHWHWTDTNKGPSSDGASDAKSTEFRFEESHIPGPHPWTFRIDEKGVFQVYDDKPADLDGGKEPAFDVPSIREYFVDLDYVLGVIADGPMKSFAFRRLKYLASKFEMYVLLNESQEIADMKILNTVQDVVIFRDGAHLTLEQVFQSLKLTAYDLSIDTLDMHAHTDAFHRFDKFNLKYNPIGESRLREIFLKTDNFIEGRYLAELTRQVMTDLEQSKYQNCEWRISIYGRSADEWDKLARWVINNKLYSHNVRWLIQVPRLYDVYKANGSINTFEDIVINVFRPLFEVTKDPTSHPELHVFLQRVIGFDTVDDESKVERRIYKKFPYPRLWNTRQSPPYSYWIYYMFSNMASLNHWRQLRGFNTFVFRPHCGEAGDTDHLTSAFLCSHSISHGILLRKVPALQYLFYLKQIGIAMSPLSNNALFLTYERNPLPDFFKTGLNVSLSTDDPLQFHFTKEPLLEEYSVAAHSSLAELARNSVVQSGFEMEIKRHWLGHQWYFPGSLGNDINKTNVPNIRLAFRHQTLLAELDMIGGRN